MVLVQLPWRAGMIGRLIAQLPLLLLVGLHIRFVGIPRLVPAAPLAPLIESQRICWDAIALPLLRMRGARFIVRLCKVRVAVLPGRASCRDDNPLFLNNRERQLTGKVADQAGATDALRQNAVHLIPLKPEGALDLLAVDDQRRRITDFYGQPTESVFEADDKHQAQHADNRDDLCYSA